jgi:uncharacterized Ntn-hydrolase superfamily protein
MTYSIVARDEATGALGVAAETCMFAVGSQVPWAQAGVGVVATQGIGEPAYGPRCLERLAAGASAREALAAAQADDPMAVLRQVGVLGADGSVEATTGEWCVDHAGHVVGDGFAVQANMVSDPSVWRDMASAFVDASGPLAHRLLAALVAGEAAGGDARGRMSAMLLVVDGSPPSQPGGGVVADLRVDRSEDPLGDLAELLVAGDAFAGFHSAVGQLFGGDPEGALATVDRALGVMPDDRNMRFVRAGALIASGDMEEAKHDLRKLVAEQPTFEVIIRSFVTKGLIALPDDISIDAVLASLDGQRRRADSR